MTNCAECNNILTQYNTKKTGFRIQIGIWHFRLQRLCDSCTPVLFSINRDKVKQV